MSIRLSLYSAGRYLRTKKGNVFVSKLLLITMLTVTLSVMLPIIVLSVINGFHESVGEKVLSFNYHVKLQDRENQFKGYKELIKELESDVRVKLAAPFFESEGFVKSEYEDRIYFVTIKAINNKEIERNELFKKHFVMEKKESFIISEGGTLELGRDEEELSFRLETAEEIIIGGVLGNVLGVFVGDNISLFLPSGDIDFDRSSKIKQFKLKGFYSAGYGRFDKSIVFINFKALKEVFSFELLPSRIGLLLKEEKDIKEYVKELRLSYPSLYISSTLEQGIFQDFEREKQLMLIILFLLLSSSFVTMYVSIRVIVIDKRQEIGILKTLGLVSKRIEQIFLLKGYVISFFGVFLGVGLGILLTISLTEIIILVESTVNFVKTTFYKYIGTELGFGYPYPFYIMDPNVFYLESFPKKIEYKDILLISSGAILLGMVASYFPARKAVREKVSEALTR